MIFALATDDCGLMIFRDEAEAVTYCEGIDVSEGGWEFFGSDGMPLQPHFSKSAARGKAVVESGEYSLHPAIEAGRPTLSERLGAVAYVEGPPGLASVSDVKRLLTSGSSGRPRRGRR